MSTEHERSLEAQVIVLPALKKALEVLEEKQRLQGPEDYESPVAINEKEDFRNQTTLALISMKLNANKEKWQAKVKKLRQELKEEFIELGDVISAIEVDEVYCEYLMELGKFEEAITIAQHITDGFVIPDPETVRDQGFLAFMAAKMQEEQFGEKKGHILIVIARKLIKLGNLVEAEKLVQDVDLNQQGSGYFSALLSYYKERSDIAAIEAFIVDMDERVALAQTDEDDYLEYWRLLSALSNEAKEAIAEIQAKSGDINGAIASIEGITVGNYRIIEQIKFVEKLLKEGKEVEARKVAQSIINDLNANTSELPDKKFGGDEEEADETIGSLNFLKSKQTEAEADEEKFEFQNYDRAEKLVTLAKVLAKYPECRDLFDLCVNGTNGTRTIADSILLANKGSQTYLWSNLIRVFGQVKDREKLDEAYKTGCELYPDSVKFLTKEYAHALYDLDREKAFELISSDSSPERKAISFSKVIFEKLSQNESFSKWKEYIDELWEMENAILKPEKETGFTIEDFNSLKQIEDGKDEDPDKQVQVSATVGSITISLKSQMPSRSKFSRRSHGLLANLAKLAITKGEWDAFAKILEDERLSGRMRVIVLSEVTNWLKEGKELKLWF